jgi:TraG P-loop domain
MSGINNITLYIYIPAAILLLIIFLIAFKFNIVERFARLFGSLLGRGASWLTNPELGYGTVVESIPYRDFWQDGVIETDTHLWAGIEFKPICTDGFTPDEWNKLYDDLTRLLITIPDESIVQSYIRVENTAQRAIKLLREIAAKCPIKSLQQVALVRMKFLYDRAKAGHLKDERRFILVGLPIKQSGFSVSAPQFISKKEFTDLERNAFVTRFKETLRNRDVFGQAFEKMGGKAYKLSIDTVFNEVYKRLNPKRAIKHPAPSIFYPKLYNFTDFAFRKLNRQEQDAMLNKYASDNDLSVFSDSPREALCYSELEKKDNHLLIDETPTVTISVQKQNLKSFAGLLQILTRSAGIPFDYTISSSFMIGNQYAWDDKLERMQEKSEEAIDDSAQKGKSNLKQIYRGRDITNVRAQLRNNSDKVGEMSFQITVEGKDSEELYTKRDEIITACRNLEGMEMTVEKHVLPSQFFSSLPCGDIRKDFRKKPSLISHYVGLAGLTGATDGVPITEATDVFLRADGGLFYWNPFASTFQSGMSVTCGGSGSGKSAFSNLDIVSKLMNGREGVAFDFGGSTYRVCQAVGGNFIRIGENSKGLGLFDVYKRAGENYKPEELNEYGIPLEGLQFVGHILETLCLDPKNQDTSLNPALTNFILEKAQKVYENRALTEDIPILEDFLREINNCRREDREYANEVIGRLKIYGSHSTYGSMLNDRSRAPESTNRYTVFDFTSVNSDSRTRLIAALGAGRYLYRFLRRNPDKKKFFFVDELHQLKKEPIVRTLIDDYFRTARKKKVLCSVASQDPEDFVSRELGGIRSSMEVKFLFATQKLNLVKEAFELEDGIVDVLDAVSREANADYRDCLVIYPGNKVARLRLHLSSIEQRLFLGAGREKVDVKQCEADLRSVIGKAEIDPHLWEALKASGTGE